jgi:hypothetical protein
VVPLGRQLSSSYIAAAFNSVADRSTVSTEDAQLAGRQLDDNHMPETNGRMSVCRRCGSQTDGPGGQHHAPAERQLTRSGEWLLAQLRIGHIDRMKAAREG